MEFTTRLQVAILSNPTRGSFFLEMWLRPEGRAHPVQPGPPQQQPTPKRRRRRRPGIAKRHRSRKQQEGGRTPAAKGSQPALPVIIAPRTQSWWKGSNLPGQRPTASSAPQTETSDGIHPLRPRPRKSSHRGIAKAGKGKRLALDTLTQDGEILPKDPRNIERLATAMRSEELIAISTLQGIRLAFGKHGQRDVGLVQTEATRARVKMLRQGYYTLKTAFELVHGTPKDLKGTRNRRIAALFLKFLAHTVHTGPAAIKRVAHLWRALALDPTKLVRCPEEIFLPRAHVSKERLFTASTIGRAIYIDTSYRFEQAMNETRDSWNQPAPLITSETLDRIDSFTRRACRLRATDKTKWPLPVPSGTACLERSRRLGGTRKAMEELSAQKAHMLTTTSQFGPLPPVAGKAKGSPWGTPGVEKFSTSARAKEATAKAPAGKVLKALIVEEVNPTPYEHFQNALTEVQGYRQPPEIRALPICELGGKVRVASISPCELSHLARVFNRRLLPILERMRAHKWTLWGKPAHLRGKTNAQIYSADLSKATDRIGHKLAQRVLMTIAEEQDWTPAERSTIPALAGPQLLDRTPTTNGIHMGLGTSWTILSLLNSWCASGAPTDSYQICGDDLIALWTPAQIDSYERRLQSIGLVSNRDKAFFGQAGVYCEQLVVLTRDDGVGKEAKTMSLLRLAEAAGAKQRAGLTDGELPLRENLITKLGEKQPRPIRRLAEHTLGRSQPKHIRRGPIPFGGDGRRIQGTDFYVDFVATMLFGTISLNQVEKTLTWQRLMATISGSKLTGPTQKNEVHLGTFRPTALSAMASQEMLPKGTALSTKSFIRITLARRKAAMKLLKGGLTLYQVMSKARNLSHKARRSALSLLRRTKSYTTSSTPPSTDVLRRLVTLTTRGKTLPRFPAEALTAAMSACGLARPQTQLGTERRWPWEQEAP